MSSKNINKEILFLFPNDKSIITTPKLYVQLTGSHSLAIVLNQLLFWSNKSSNNDWFYKSYEDWSEETEISIRTLKRRFDKLESMGFISTKIKLVHGKTLKHFFVHVDKIIDCLKNTYPDKVGRSASDNLADPTIIYTDEYRQTTDEQSVSNSFFSKNQTEELLALKPESDLRTAEEFIENCQHHVEIQRNEMNSFQRFYGLKKILTSSKASNTAFNAIGFKLRESQRAKSLEVSNKLFEARIRAQEDAWESKSNNSLKKEVSVANRPARRLSDMLKDFKKDSIAN